LIDHASPEFGGGGAKLRSGGRGGARQDKRDQERETGQNSFSWVMAILRRFQRSREM
jgi:hypothetical protein